MRGGNRRRRERGFGGLGGGGGGPGLLFFFAFEIGLGLDENAARNDDARRTPSGLIFHRRRHGGFDGRRRRRLDLGLGKFRDQGLGRNVIDRAGRRFDVEITVLQQGNQFLVLQADFFGELVNADAHQAVVAGGRRWAGTLTEMVRDGGLRAHTPREV